MLILALMSLSDCQPVGLGISASLLIRVTKEGCVLHSLSDNSHRVEPQLPTVASLLTLSFLLWKWSQEARRQSSHVVPLNVNYRNCQLQIPTGKDVRCISSKTLATATTQSTRNHHHLELLLFSNRLSLKTTPVPTFYFFSIKQHSSPLFVGLAYGVWVSLCGCVLSRSVISARLLCPWDSFSCLILRFLCYSWTDPLLLVK